MYLFIEDSLEPETTSKSSFVNARSVRRYEPHHEKTCLMPYVNNKGADQPAHTCSLISTFVIRWLDSILNPKFQDSS